MERGVRGNNEMGEGTGRLTGTGSLTRVACPSALGRIGTSRSNLMRGVNLGRECAMSISLSVWQIQYEFYTSRH